MTPTTEYRYPRAHIAVFARVPVAGAVKTRLIPALGAAGALALYRAMCERTLDLVRASALAPHSIWLSDNQHAVADCDSPSLAFGGDTDLYQQAGDDLGQRMSGCAAAVLERPETDSVLIIGTDCPALDRNYLEAALAALMGGNDLVLGPAADGGYVLIGLSRPLPAVFQAIDWGTPAVLAQTCAQAEQAGISYSLLPGLWDVDEEADLARLAALQPPLAWP